MTHFFAEPFEHYPIPVCLAPKSAKRDASPTLRHVPRLGRSLALPPGARPLSVYIVRRLGSHLAQVQPPLLLLALQRESARDQGTIHWRISLIGFRIKG
jgi:hypothetical protein